MNAKELRIGNFIEGFYLEDWREDEAEDEIRKSSICKVVALDSVGVSEYSIWVEVNSEESIEKFDDFKGIPLTKNDIVKIIGLEYREISRVQDHYHHINNNLQVLIFKNGRIDVTIKGFYFKDFGLKNKHYKYLHQLQNLYFVLTGEELELED